MGCWEGTCGVTQLPIRQGQPVRLILLVTRPEYFAMGGGVVHSTHFAVPQFLAIKGVYDGAGCIIPEENWHSRYVLESFRDWLAHKFIQVKKTDGPWQKKTDPRKYPTLLNWLNAIERGYVYRVVNDNTAIHQLAAGHFQFMLVLEPVYQLGVQLAATWQKERGQDYTAAISKTMQLMLSVVADTKRPKELSDVFLGEELEIFCIFNVGTELWDHHLARYIRQQFSKKQKVTAALAAATEFRHFFNFMVGMRRPFLQQVGTGATITPEAFLMHATVFRLAEMIAREQFQLMEQ